MKTIKDYIISEKLKINKDFKNVNDNNTFYATFKKDIQSISLRHLWNFYEHAADIVELKRRSYPNEETYNELVNNFDNLKSSKVMSKVMFFTWTEDEFLKVIYNSMMKFIFDNEDTMNFKMKQTYESPHGFEFYIYVFETDDALIGLDGPPRVNNMSDYGHILFRYK